MYYYVVNPAAGHGQINSLQDKIRDRLSELGIKGEWVKTAAPGEATRITEAAIKAGHTTIIAVGGDDTLNEVINGVSTENVAVGVIPTGHRNRLATQLGIITWQQACDALAARRLTPYSLIAAGQKYFLSTLTLGFETDLDKQLGEPETTWRGKTKEFVRSFTHARRYQSLHIKIEVDEQFRLECDTFNLAIANQKFLNPLADNRLIVALSDKPGQGFKMSKLVWKRLRNADLSGFEDTATTRFTASRVVITTDPPTGIMADGKVTGRTPIAIRLTDRRIRFITEKIAADFKGAIIDQR